MTHTKKLSPDTGKVAALADERGKREQNRKKGFLRSNIKYLPVILERSGESRQRLQGLNILTCVRTLASIASRGSSLPSAFGGSERPRKKEIVVFIILNTPLTISFVGFLPLRLVGYSVSLHFSVATLLKIQFDCHRS